MSANHLALVGVERAFERGPAVDARRVVGLQVGEISTFQRLQRPALCSASSSGHRHAAAGRRAGRLGWRRACVAPPSTAPSSRCLAHRPHADVGAVAGGGDPGIRHGHESSSTQRLKQSLARQSVEP